MRTPTERFALGLSPDGHSFYSFYAVASIIHDSVELDFLSNLSTLYPRALAKAYFLSEGGSVRLFVPPERRVLRGDCTTQGDRKALGYQVMPFGKHSNVPIKELVQSDPSYVQWFFHSVDPRRADGSWRESVIDVMATMLYYWPSLCGGTFGSQPVFTALRYKKSGSQQVTKRRPRRKKASQQQPTLPGMEDLSPLRLADPDMDDRLRQILGGE